MSIDSTDELLDKLSYTFEEIVKQSAVGTIRVSKRREKSDDGSSVDVYVAPVDELTGQTLMHDVTSQHLQISVYQESFILAADQVLNRIAMLKLLATVGDDYRNQQNVSKLRELYRQRNSITEQALNDVILALAESVEEIDQQLTQSRACLN